MDLLQTAASPLFFYSSLQDRFGNLLNSPLWHSNPKSSERAARTHSHSLAFTVILSIWLFAFPHLNQFTLSFATGGEKKKKKKAMSTNEIKEALTENSHMQVGRTHPLAHPPTPQQQLPVLAC